MLRKFAVLWVFLVVLLVVVISTQIHSHGSWLPVPNLEVEDRLVVGRSYPTPFVLDGGVIAGGFVSSQPQGTFAFLGAVETPRASFTSLQAGCLDCPEPPRLLFKASDSGFAATISPRGHWMISEVDGHPTAEELLPLDVPGSERSLAIYWFDGRLWVARLSGGEVIVQALLFLPLPSTKGSVE